MGRLLCARALLTPRVATQSARWTLGVRRFHISPALLAATSARQLAKAPATIKPTASSIVNDAASTLSAQAELGPKKPKAGNAFTRLPLDRGLVEQVTNQIEARNALRLDGGPDEPVRLSPVQRASFEHFFGHRDTLTHRPEVSWARIFRGQEGFLFPRAPGTSTLLGGETGGGKTAAYLLPLLQRLLDTRGQSRAEISAGIPSTTEAEQSDASTEAEVSENEAASDKVDDSQEAEEEEWTEAELREFGQFEEEEEPLDWVPDEELDDLEAFLRSKTKGRFESGIETEVRQRRALAMKDQLEAWDPEAKEDPEFLVQPRSVILAPTHELARQIASNIKSLTRTVEMRTLCTSQSKWIESLRKDVRLMQRGRWQEVRPIDVLVTTPGRLLDITTPTIQRVEKFKALHERYTRSGDVVKAEQIERHLEKVRAQQLVSLGAVQAIVCDEADTLWDTNHYESTRHLVRAVYDDRIDAWRRAQEGEDLPLVPADIIHVTASVTPAFKRQLANRFPGTINVLSKFLHQLPPTVRVKYVPILPSFNEAFVTQVAEALAADPTGRSKVLVICERRESIGWAQKVLKQAEILSCTLSRESREHSIANDKNLVDFLIDLRRLIPSPNQEKEASPGTPTPEKELLDRVQERKPSAPKEPETTLVDGLNAAAATEKPIETPSEEALLDEDAQRELELAILNGVDPLEIKRLKERLANPLIKEEEKAEQHPAPKSKKAEQATPKKSKAPETPRVLITTSHLTRGIDFSPLVTHVIVPDSRPKAKTKVIPSMSDRHVTDTMELLHRAGRVGRGGVRATLVLLDKVDLKTGRPNVKDKDRQHLSTTLRFKSAVKSVRSVKLSVREQKALRPKKQWKGYNWGSRSGRQSGANRGSKWGSRSDYEPDFDSRFER